ncbi:cellulose synthase-like D3 [Actinidia rufa]|uniref:Cellulose synthase-like D3 n=1 Tax=Actinidia rufa TaxID=165716 RepID=A0A7J0H2S9_9ERIC|nr:cellulose synthase-like D3 [Actinidia rufa]
MASRSFKASDSQQGKGIPMSVTFARRTSSGRYVNYSRESNDLDSEIEHSRGDHAGIIQVMLKPPSDEPLHGAAADSTPIDLTEIDIRLPLLVYVSREKRPGSQIGGTFTFP